MVVFKTLPVIEIVIFEFMMPGADTRWLNISLLKRDYASQILLGNFLRSFYYCVFHF